MTKTHRRILVVDDSRTVRKKIRQELEAGGHEVIEAGDGFEALTRAVSRPIVDLITMDVEMPKMNGFDAYRKLRKPPYSALMAESRKTHMPVIFITGNDTMEDRRTGFELGATDFITKPFEAGAVLEIVNEILFPASIPKGILALVADDSRVSRRVAVSCLSREGIEVLEAGNGLEAYDIIREKGADLDIVLTDLMMPEMDGKVLCRKIRREFGMPDIPIIVLTAVSDLSNLLEVFKAGASDYLVKPFVKEELLARISVHLERNRMNKKLRETVENLKQANTEIKRLSIRDPLTGCFNRGYLNSQMVKEIKRSMRYRTPVSLALSDIDHFKKVNDTYGHQCGDEVLKVFADTLQSRIRNEVDWVSRYGGEEFVIVFPGTELADAATATEKIRQAVADTPIPYGNQKLNISASFGVAVLDAFKDDANEAAEKLLRTADERLYAAKNSGRNRVVVEI